MLDLENMNLEVEDHALLCQICNMQKHKYRCPKCQYKTCSLACCKQHKEDYNCDGIKPSFVSISKFSEFNDEKSIEDQKFLHNLSQSILKDCGHGQKRKNSHDLNHENFNLGFRKKKEKKLEDKLDNEDLIEESTEVHENNEEEKTTNYLNNQDKQLFSNCHKKRIWLQYNENKNFEGSRYESYSDVINWSIKLEFVKEFNDDGSMKIEKVEDTSEYNVKEEVNLEAGVHFYDKNTNISEATQNCSTQGNFKESQLSNGDVSTDVIVKDELEGIITSKIIPSPLEDGEYDESDDESPEELSSKIIPVEEDIKTEYVVPKKTNEIFFEDTKEIKNKEIGRFAYTARNIVESIKVSTLVRQFVKPKPYGVVVSKSELDNNVMPHFINAGMENIIVYMKVPFEEKERYYVIDMNKSILDNLRNRYILHIPTFIVTLNTECSKIKTLSEVESLELHEYFKDKRNKHINGSRQNNHQNFDRNGCNRRNFNRNQRGKFNNRRGRN